MADKSKNEQYDIVAQAQDVLDLYIKRCFDISHAGKTRAFKKHTHINKGALLLSILVGCCCFGAALVYFLL